MAVTHAFVSTHEAAAYRCKGWWRGVIAVHLGMYGISSGGRYRLY